MSILDGTAPGVSGAVTVTYPPPTSMPPPPTTDEEKGFAVFDFLHLLPQAAVECDNIQLLADLFAPFSDVDLVPAITDLCNADVDRLVDDFFIYLDPPDKRIGIVAVPVKVSATDVRLPVCPRRGHDAARCRRLPRVGVLRHRGAQGHVDRRRAAHDIRPPVQRPPAWQRRGH